MVRLELKAMIYFMHTAAVAFSKTRHFPLTTFRYSPSGSFEGRATIDGATVTLHRVTQEDAGEYRCEISAHLDVVNLGETNVTLKVLGKGSAGKCSRIFLLLSFRSRFAHLVAQCLHTHRPAKSPLQP